MQSAPGSDVLHSHNVREENYNIYIIEGAQTASIDCMSLGYHRSQFKRQEHGLRDEIEARMMARAG
jgi:hypothetical protein